MDKELGSETPWPYHWALRKRYPHALRLCDDDIGVLGRTD